LVKIIQAKVKIHKMLGRKAMTNIIFCFIIKKDYVGSGFRQGVWGIMDWSGMRRYQRILLALGCVLVNYGGKQLAVHCRLPIWLDAVGTTLAAYVLGPVWGSLVGMAGNVLYGFTNPVSYVYALTSLSIGLCVGYLARRRFFRSFFETLSISVLVALVSTVISVALNVVFYAGMTNNLWGDGVIGYLGERSFPIVSCYFIGEFYIDFLDKVLTFLLLYFLLKAYRKFNITGKSPADGAGSAGKSTGTSGSGNVARGMAVLLAVSCAVSMSFSMCMPVGAAEGEQDFAVDGYISYIQTIYNSSNGLPCGTANDVVQTGDGILWIGTYSGLYRYNGREMSLQDEYASIKNVNCLYVDGDDRLWIGTNDNGFSISRDGKITDVMEAEDGLSSNSVRCIVQCSDGSYYIGTTGSMQVVGLDGGLHILGGIESVNYAVCVTADKSGHVAAVDTNGMLYLLQNQEVVASCGLDEGQGMFNSCFFGEDGLLYVGTSTNRICAYDISAGGLNKKNAYACGELQSINSIYFTNEGGAYVCADNGVGYMDSEWNYSAVATGQFNNSIDNMTVDYQGNLWFASSRMGLLRLCESGVLDYYEALGLERKVVNTSEFWNGCLYVGTDSGLDVLDLSAGRAVDNELTKMLSGIRIRCMLADSDNRLWICTYGSGLWEVDGDVITTYDTKNGTFGDRARAVLQMSDGTIAAAGDNGIIFINDGEITNRFQYGTGLSNAMVLTLMELPDGALMAGTDGDGIVIIKDGAVADTVTRADGLSSDVILRTVRDGAGDGTFVITSNGLCYIDGDGSARLLDNFPYFNNYDVHETGDGKLYVLGSAGIYVVDRDELMSGGDVQYSLLDAKMGLTASLTVNSWNECTDDGYLYISCDTGVYGIDTMYASRHQDSYIMRVASIRLDQASNEVGEGSVFTIGRDVSKIEIVPEVINYTTEDPYVTYYLEGFEQSPNVVELSDLGSIVYTNVPSGEYVFHLGVLDDDQRTVIQETTYRLVKVREIYDNAWFTVYMIVVMALFVSWLTWFIVRTQIQRTLNFQKRELEFARTQVEMGNQTILAIARTVDAKDERTSHHSQRVAEYSVLIARELGQSDEECENLRKTALLHDIGKIGIPDSVLNKPGKLTDEEYEIMKSHVVRGAEILKDFTIVEHVWEGALYHHERYDGKGYSKGLAGEEIPLNARIIGLADAFDAMTANRVYRKKLDFSVVLTELEKGRGTQFDPKLVDILLGLMDTGKIDVEKLYS
jgi:energy-coupling factor transport system substrate-specific component